MIVFKQDTGISVRKRVIKILRDICLELPDFHKITEMCVRMIRRVNDEEGIKVSVFHISYFHSVVVSLWLIITTNSAFQKKLVNETFQKLWFTPTPNHDQEAMTRKILNITDVVSPLCECVAVNTFILIYSFLYWHYKQK